MSLRRSTLALFLLAACGGGDSAQPVHERHGALPVPDRDVHVVVYLVDTLRADRLGVYGYDRPTSPHLDALAEECVVFDSAHAAAPWTLPSVVSLMTATYPVEHGVVKRGDGLAADVATLPERLQALGYTTAGFVRNPYGGVGAGLARGYDHLEGIEKGEHAVDLAAVAAWLDAQRGKKHFLYLHSTEPHRPYRAPPEYLERLGHPGDGTKPYVHRHMGDLRNLSRADFDAGEMPGSNDNDAGQRAAIEALAARRQAVDALYDSGVAWADANVGALVQLLKERGLWEDTLFLFLSDHGEELFDHGNWLHHQTLYGELVHVPFLVHFPGGARPMERCASPVTLVDVLPSVLDYLGEGPGRTSGESFLPKLAPGTPPAPRIVANRINRMHHFGPDVALRGNLNVAIVLEQWKGIWNLEPDTFELYDLSTDPGEQVDLSAREPERAKALREYAAAWFESRSKRGEGPEHIELDPQVLEALKGMGYAR